MENDEKFFLFCLFHNVWKLYIIFRIRIDVGGNGEDVVHEGFVNRLKNPLRYSKGRL